MKHFLFALSLIAATPAFAQEPPKAPTPDETSNSVDAPQAQKPVLTADEGRQLYELGVTTGMAQGAIQAAQAKAKSAIDKLK